MTLVSIHQKKNKGNAAWIKQMGRPIIDWLDYIAYNLVLIHVHIAHSYEIAASLLFAFVDVSLVNIRICHLWNREKLWIQL